MTTPMILAAALLSCTPLPTCDDNPGVFPCSAPTTVLEWSPSVYCHLHPGQEGYDVDCDVSAYRVYKRVFPFTTWTLAAENRCRWIVGDFGELYRDCNHYHVPQKVDDVELEEMEWCVKAVRADGVESAACSNVVRECRPPIWDGPPSEYR